MASDSRGHRWRFFRAGGFDQVRLDSGADLLALPELDQKLWVALSCPVHGLEFDEKTLELIDSDKDGRIRAPEILAAVKWAGSVLKHADGLVKGGATLPLNAIDHEGEEGKRLLASAREILSNLGKKGTKEISLEDTADTAKIFAQTKFNGDGIIPVESAEEASVQQVIRDIIDCLGSDTDRSGAPGVTQARVDQFFTEAEAFSVWWKSAEDAAAEVLPLGERTLAVADTFRAVKAKIDDYFARTRLVAFDARAAGPLNGAEAEYAVVGTKELSATAQEIAAFPLSHIEADRPLPLHKGLNPAWAAPVARLVADVITPALGDKDALTDAEWVALSARFAAFEAWRARKAGTVVEKLGLPRVREILASGAKAALDALVAADKALEPEANAIASVDKLIRYHRDLYTLINNFVTFRDFYSRKKKALFQAGTLYLDGRSCELCIKVADATAHATLATLGGCFLAYCECNRKATGEKMVIAAAITGGDSDELMVGRNGIFYDRKGKDWDATVLKLVDHPISIRQAFFTPYKIVAKLISEQAEKFASARDKETHEKAGTVVADGAKVAVDAPTGAPPAPQPPFDIGKFTGIFAAIGIALGALGSALAAVFVGLLSLSWWQLPFVFAGVALAISGPSMILAALKLRRRNIGPLLDANGWAVNARAKMNIPFGGSLTAVAALPANSERSLDDPFAEKATPWKRYAFLIFLVALIVGGWKVGLIELMVEKLKPPPRPVPAASAAPAVSGAPAAPAAPK